VTCRLEWRNVKVVGDIWSSPDPTSSDPSAYLLEIVLPVHMPGEVCEPGRFLSEACAAPLCHAFGASSPKK
jgi:hypothetical protein